MFKKLAAPAVIVLALLIGTSACAASEVKASKFQSALKKEAKFSDKEAACVTTKVFKQLDQKQIQKIYTAADVKDVATKTYDAWLAILRSCAVT